MTKLREGDSWMPAPEYGRSLRGAGFNILVESIDRALPFQTKVLGAEVIYSDPDIAVLTCDGGQWMLHAWHTYDAHPLHETLTTETTRGVGVELRIFGRDPDLAAAQARALGYEIVQPPADKPHGLRECFIRDRAGYIWVPSLPLAQ